MIIGVDYDGTVVEHCYPRIGPECPGASKWLKYLTEQGAKLILWTMRDGDELAAAVKWFQERGIPLMGANRNPDQTSWTSSPKAYCHVYVDDCGVLIPTLPGPTSDRPMVDWEIVGPALQKLLDRYKALGRLH